MWLLSTARAELKYFVSPESVGGYAILSHVWTEVEQSHQDIQALRTLCIQTGQNPRDLASNKIRRCCELAEKHGYRWLWIDTCCIDKTSSAELSEAINSMFRYYSLADVCYAYLDDVPSALKPEIWRPSFRKSRWHLRGWTLQELLAPRLLLVVSQSWDILGSKADLAVAIENTTGIPATVLRFQQRLSDVCIAQRMSWAAFRETTRVEDEAYCLMGIFGINMPTLYGEGRAAFQRLQEEILRRYTDTTLFAWGLTREIPQWRMSDGPAIAITHDRHEHTEGLCLFAPSPVAFANSRHIRYIPPSARPDKDSSVQADVGGVPTFAVTSHGVHARIPIIEHDGVTLANLSWQAHGDTPLGLVLAPCPLSADPLRPLYDIGIPSGYRAKVAYDYARLARLPPRVRRDGGDDIDEQAQTLSESGPVWRDVCLAHRPHLGPGHETIPVGAQGFDLPVDNGFNSPFRFRQLQGRVLQSPDNVTLCSVDQPSQPWTGSSPMVLTFQKRGWQTITTSSASRPLYSDHDFLFVLRLGRCTVTRSESSPAYEARLEDGIELLGDHWATVQFLSTSTTEALPQSSTAPPHHDCARDHIRDWSGGSKTFESLLEESFNHRSLHTTAWKNDVSLSFSPCPLNPDNSLLVSIDHARSTMQYERRAERMQKRSSKSSRSTRQQPSAPYYEHLLKR